MAQPVTPIPVEHHPMIHEVESASPEEPRRYTLLELIEAVSEVSESEEEVVATVTFMLRSGRIRLTGNFRDTPIPDLCD